MFRYSYFLFCENGADTARLQFLKHIWKKSQTCANIKERANYQKMKDELQACTAARASHTLNLKFDRDGCYAPWGSNQKTLTYELKQSWSYDSVLIVAEHFQRRKDSTKRRRCWVRAWSVRAEIQLRSRVCCDNAGDKGQSGEQGMIREDDVDVS